MKSTVVDESLSTNATRVLFQGKNTSLLRYGSYFCCLNEQKLWTEQRNSFIIQCSHILCEIKWNNFPEFFIFSQRIKITLSRYWQNCLIFLWLYNFIIKSLILFQVFLSMRETWNYYIITSSSSSCCSPWVARPDFCSRWVTRLVTVLLTLSKERGRLLTPTNGFGAAGLKKSGLDSVRLDSLNTVLIPR